MTCFLDEHGYKCQKTKNQYTNITRIVLQVRHIITVLYRKRTVIQFIFINYYRWLSTKTIHWLSVLSSVFLMTLLLFSFWFQIQNITEYRNRSLSGFHHSSFLIGQIIFSFFFQIHFFFDYLPLVLRTKTNRKKNTQLT